MKKEVQSHTIASIGTIVLMGLLFLLLWFVFLQVPVPEEDEGIVVSFGEEMVGGGVPEANIASNAVPVTTAPPPSPSAPSSNDLLVQEDESAMKLPEQREQEERDRKAQQEREQAEKARQEQLQAERIAQEQRLAEQRAREQAAIDKANAMMGGLFGQTDSEQGSNGATASSASSADKGNPIGKGSSDGNSWSLNGRRIKGSLPKPDNTFNQEGIVVVNIIVDKAGKVVSAKQGKGTTISDHATIQIAIRAAYKANFNDTERPDKQVGTITYRFKFN